MTDQIKNIKLAIIGLGYVGLPLALEFAKKKKVIGYDLNKKRIKELKNGFDKNFEFNKKQLKKSKNLRLTFNKKDLKYANCYIISVPTPVDRFKKPDLRPLFNASKMVGKLIKKGIISKGMLPKIESALEAVSSGVEHVQIINGTIDHSVLLELFTDSGIGTMIRRL